MSILQLLPFAFQDLILLRLITALLDFLVPGFTRFRWIVSAIPADGRVPCVRGGRRAVTAQVAGEGGALLPRLRDGPGRVAEHRGGVQCGRGTGQKEECCIHAMR